MFFNMFFCIFLILLSFCNSPKTIFYMIYKTYKIYKKSALFGRFFNFQ